MLSKVVGTAFLAGAALVAVPVAASATVVSPEPAPVGSACIPGDSGLGTGDPKFPVDQQANVYVGGNFEYRVGAELEGLLVVEGDATFDSGLLYNMGVVGVGSLMTPEPMSDMLVVGGDMTVSSGRIDLGHGIGGKVRVGGTLTAPEGGLDANGGTVLPGLGKAEALGKWAGVGVHLQQQSAKYAAMPATGEVTVDGDTLVLTGDGTKNRQVFTVTQDELTQMGTLQYRDIHPEAIVVVNVTGDTAHFALQSVADANRVILDPSNVHAAEFGALTQRLLWNISEASTVTIGNGAQFPGTVLVANPDSSTVMEAAGTNGRFWVAGDLEHNRAGSEFHAFPFLDSDAFSCTPVPPVGEPGDPIEPEPFIELVSPKVTHAVCLDEGKIVQPVIDFADLAGVKFSIDGEVKAGATVTVIATATGKALLAQAKGWKLSPDAKRATMQVVLEKVACEDPDIPEPGEPAQPNEPDEPAVPNDPNEPAVPNDSAGPRGESFGAFEAEKPAQPTEKASGLAATGGAPAAGLVAGAITLLMAGFATVVTARRRNLEQTHE